MCLTRLRSSDSITVRAGGSVAIVGSVTTSTSDAPISFRSMPTSRVTPTPKRTLETAISNAKSFFIDRSLMYKSGGSMTSIAGLVVAISLMQNPAPATASAGAISGRVTVEGTDTPLADARVMLMPAGRPMMQGPFTPPQAVTDQDGRFVFRGLKPGEYRISVQRTGYASLEEPGRGRIVTLAAGQSIDNLQLQLQKGGVISGRVLTPSGEPAVDIRVMALRRVAPPGMAARLLPAPMQGMQQTNDLGEFRLAGLAAGDYYVSAAPQPTSPFGGPGVTPGAAQSTSRTTLATT